MKNIKEKYKYLGTKINYSCIMYLVWSSGYILYLLSLCLIIFILRNYSNKIPNDFEGKMRVYNFYLFCIYFHSIFFKKIMTKINFGTSIADWLAVQAGYSILNDIQFYLYIKKLKSLISKNKNSRKKNDINVVIKIINNYLDSINSYDFSLF